MARLFITPRELDLISHYTKEIIKDVVGQKVYYYKVRRDLSKVHDVYEESEEKIFDPPVEIDARIEWAQATVNTGRFGTDEMSNITVWLQYRDVMHKQLDVESGDYLSYGETFFEVTSATIDSTIFGQIEYSTGYILKARQARRGLIDKIPHGPTDESYSDEDATQRVFVQQRGFAENRLGPTGDYRALIEQGKLELPISDEPAEVSPRGAEDGIGSSFYADEGIKE
jgi:hypothetical protein